jgi:hypothetical protein
MFSRIMGVLFGCTHNHYSFPITVKKNTRSRASFPTGTYVVCLDCGREMPYDWKQMKIVSATPSAVGVPALAPKQAA